MHQGLRVAGRTHGVTVRQQGAAKLLIVIHFPVIDNPDRPILVGERLMGQGREVNDREAAMAQKDAVVKDPLPFGVRSPVPNAITHLLKR